MPAFFLILASAVLSVLLTSSNAAAYPWMIKHGYSNCAPCHADPSGGELLTEYGRVLSNELLSSPIFHEDEPAEGAPAPRYAPFFGVVPAPEALVLGGSVRLASSFRPEQETEAFKVFPMQLDLYGLARLTSHLKVAASVGVAKVPAGSPHARAAQVTTNQGDGYNLVSRTHYLGWTFGDEGSEVRVGRLNLPFGLRLSEHTLWVREQTQTDRDSDQQHGAALYLQFERGRVEAMAIAGNYQINPDRMRERGYAAYAEFFPWRGAALGVSTLFTVAGDDRLSPVRKRTIRQVNGATLRVALDEVFVVMAEVDLLRRSRRNPGYTGLLQIDAEPIRGFHAIGSVEVLDAGSARNELEPKLPGVGKPKVGGWLSAQWFVASHFDARVDGILRKGEPFQLFAQLHVYL